MNSSAALSLINSNLKGRFAHSSVCMPVCYQWVHAPAFERGNVATVVLVQNLHQHAPQCLLGSKDDGLHTYWCTYFLQLLAHSSDIRYEHWLGWVFLCVFLPASGCGREGPLHCSHWVSISYEDFLQVVRFLLFVGVLTNLVGSVAHALHHTCEHPRVVVGMEG